MGGKLKAGYTITYVHISIVSDFYKSFRRSYRQNNNAYKITDDAMMTCDAPKCSKSVTCKIFTCGVCNKKIHTLCDPKTKSMKQRAINVINYYCSFH